MQTFYDESKRIWCGRKEPFIYGEQDSLGSVALQCLLEEPDRIAQICHQSGRSITCSEMAKLSAQVYTHLKTLQLQQGDVMGLCVSNSDYVAPLVLGGLMAGLCISTLDPSFDVAGVKHIYSQTRPKVMFTDGDIYGKVKEAFDDECDLSPSVVIYTVRNHIEGIASVKQFFVDDVNVMDFRVPALENGIHQTAFVVCSSGTTGFPKAVSVSHAILLSVMGPGEQFLRRKTLCFSSLYWLSGVLSLMRSAITLNTRIISENPFCPEDFFDIVELHRVNVVTGPPSHIAMALASKHLVQRPDLSSMEMYMCGGSSVPYSLIEKFKKLTPNAKFVTAYGMTENVLKVAAGYCEPGNSVGCLAANREVKIIDDDGNNLVPNARGEICIRSPFPWQGYYGDPEATKAVYDSESWYHSGDLGYFNEEGKLFVVDRKKDILKYNNFQFSPSVIEKVINEMSGVAETCVVGVSDETFGFLPAAVVIRKPCGVLHESDVRQHVTSRMQHFEQLRGGVYFVESLPRTASGKVLRRVVAKFCEKLYKENLCKITANSASEQ